MTIRLKNTSQGNNRLRKQKTTENTRRYGKKRERSAQVGMNIYKKELTVYKKLIVNKIIEAFQCTDVTKTTVSDFFVLQKILKMHTMVCLLTKINVGQHCSRLLPMFREFPPRLFHKMVTIWIYSIYGPPAFCSRNQDLNRNRDKHTPSHLT